MTGNKAFRTSVVRSAAVAILESLQALDVHWAIYGDLAWHLLCGSATGGSWRLDVHVMGDTATLAYATGRLASTDPRFSLTKQAFNSKAAMAYTHDVLNDGSPTKKHECRVNFVCSHLRDLFIVKDLPLLPIQLILYRHMEAHFQRSEKRLKKAMDKVIVISEAYLRLPNLPPSVWSLTPAERPLFLDYLAKIMSALPDTADLLARLHPVPLPVATMSPAPPPIVSAAESDSTSVVEISSSSVQERKQLFHSETVLAATRTVSSCIRQQGHDCFLAGPGYVPWYIMGSPIVPKVCPLTTLNCSFALKFQNTE
ncbi:uncharacterized protein EV420DRAFT_475598 [Desarmillaria tabescens]|uniref:Uncharacterized protein n=1 Tax=Armillaria tabescens TaxID=1929756 RepID=A0AA39KAX5_ARMTA|nr:uncharacterized protein EV420DRAFT_475598 [Desarmillaria tabescens]KAK0457735.1 hypothetical protein EV420DRAFT_475598 [Desarmillaria tabescens]